MESLFHQLEFRTLTQRLKKLNRRLNPSLNPQPEQASLFGAEPVPPSEPEPAEPLNAEFETRVITTAEELQACVDDLKTAKVLAFDTETTGIDPLQDKLVGISLAGSPERGYYIPLGHDNGEQLPLEAVIAALKLLLTDPRIDKVAHNASMICSFCGKSGLRSADHIRYNGGRVADRAGFAPPRAKARAWSLGVK